MKELPSHWWCSVRQILVEHASNEKTGRCQAVCLTSRETGRSLLRLIGNVLLPEIEVGWGKEQNHQHIEFDDDDK